MKFHLVNIIPNERFHWMHAYDEVIETICWGLAELGHDVTCGINYFETKSINILFGHRFVSVDFLRSLPRNTIIYNLEQIKGLSKEDILRNESNIYCINNFQIWEYSQFQKEIWEGLNPKYPPVVVKIGYAPVLSKITKLEYNIDVLIYGEATNNRLEIYRLLSCAGIRSVFLCGIFGSLRDNLISQSKIILNINKYSVTKIFEIVRVSYLFANKKAVLSDISTCNAVEEEIKDAVYFINNYNYVDECLRILDSDTERVTLEERGYDAIIKRDIRSILSSVI
jgi:hypothetical protein